MKKFEVGDKVFDLRFGNGRVVEVEAGRFYPVTVAFDKIQNRTYMLDGKVSGDSVAPILFHGHDLRVVVETPEFEWQVLYSVNEEWTTSVYFYPSLAEFYKARNWSDDEVIEYKAELFERSKRVRKVAV